MDVIADLQARYELERAALSIGDEEIERWSLESGHSHLKVFDSVAADLAIGFHEGRLTFDFCDRVVNCLVGHVYFGTLPTWPELFWEVFLAFDAGEFNRANDKRDPVEVYTRPLIAKIVATMGKRSKPEY